MGLIDMHCHIIPGVDDGSRSFDMSLAMLKQAAQEGITGIVATPHCRPERWDYQPDLLKERLQKLKELAVGEHIDMCFWLGSEIRWRGGVPEYLADEAYLTIADTDAVLVEFGTEDSLRTMDRALDNLLAQGYRPVIAHVERYECLHKNVDSLEEWVDRGVLIQCNASSLDGTDSFAITHFARKLLKNELIHLIGTDSHSDTWRRPQMRECRRFLEKKCSSAYAKALLQGNAEKLLGGQIK